MAIATGEAEVVEPLSSKGPHSSNNGNPLIDGRLTVRCMRRVDWTVDCMGDQVAEAIGSFGVPDPQGKRVVLMNQTKRW